MRKKIKTWLKRYLPAEIICTLAAIIIPTICSFFTDQILVIALVATWSENLGFYGTMIFQEVRKSQKIHQQKNKKYTFKSFAKDLRSIIIEFGIAEMFDSFLVRPAILFFAIERIENLQVALITGKIVADIIFYVPAIITYEINSWIKQKRS